VLGQKPKAWSHSALDSFENCPRQYYETKVVSPTKYPFVDTAEVKWGRDVHKHFENFLLYSTPLPADLDMHREFLQSFKDQPGELAGEERIALDTRLQGCAYFGAPDIWYRGQVDARKRNLAAGTSHILDHKTGKVKNDYTQLKGFAMHEFLTQPGIHTCKVEFYWTQIRGTNGETYHREQLPEIIRFFAAKLHRFADAFLEDTWIPRPSGLCNGWCPVTDCEYWKPKRKP
jgi:hypothetical protein